MGFIISTIRSITNITSGICVLLLLMTVYVAIKKKSVSVALQELRGFVEREIQSFRVVALIPVSIAIISTPLLNPATQQIIDFNNIYFKSEGDYCYYIEIDEKLYPAIISITSEEEEYGYYDEKTRKSFYCNLKEAVLWDGQVHEFDCDEPLIIGKSVCVYDSESDTYFECILHNKHAYSDLLTEDDDITTFNFVILGIQMFSYALLIYALTKKSSQSDNNNTEATG